MWYWTFAEHIWWNLCCSNSNLWFSSPWFWYASNLVVHIEVFAAAAADVEIWSDDYGYRRDFGWNYRSWWDILFNRQIIWTKWRPSAEKCRQNSSLDSWIYYSFSYYCIIFFLFVDWIHSQQITQLEVDTRSLFYGIPLINNKPPTQSASTQRTSI